MGSFVGSFLCWLKKIKKYGIILKYEFIYWHSGNTARPTATPVLIPFNFKITLPAPRYERLITNRDEQGRILHSVSP
jgi:hypothetical protein